MFYLTSFKFKIYPSIYTLYICIFLHFIYIQMLYMKTFVYPPHLCSIHSIHKYSIPYNLETHSSRIRFSYINFYIHIYVYFFFICTFSTQEDVYLSSAAGNSSSNISTLWHNNNDNLKGYTYQIIRRKRRIRRCYKFCRGMVWR